MLTPADVRILDLNSAWRGVPTNALMENAGAAVADVARRRYKHRRVLVLAGPGNNGGDGLVAARHLAREATVTVLLTVPPDRLQTPEARNAFAQVDRRRVRVEVWRSRQRFRELARDADLLVDALLGIGVTGTLHEPVRSLVRLANASRKPILSVDVPTGLGGPLAVRPDATVTLHDRKAGMTRANSGSVLVRPIGIPREAETHVGPGDLVIPYPPNSAGSHKGQNGRLLVVAGGPYCGAPVLAAAAALRTGIDLVHLYTPRDCARAARAREPDLIVHPGADERELGPDDWPPLARLLPRFDALALGPGIGRSSKTRQLVQDLVHDVARRRLPLVLDADALVLLERGLKDLARRPVLLTPHNGEAQRLLGRRPPTDLPRRIRWTQAHAKRHGVTLFLKGPVSVLTDGRHTKLSDAHPSTWTVGGVGDALTGIAGALLAKGLAPFPAACAAAFLNGAAGRRAVRAHSHAARASDLVQELGAVFRDWFPTSPFPTG